MAPLHIAVLALLAITAIYILHSYMRANAQTMKSSEKFTYDPVCRSDFLNFDRNKCHGDTSGMMPSIEDTTPPGECCGWLGVPPPVLAESY